MNINNFTNLYSVTKTLRFKLIPQGETLNNILNGKFLEKDDKRNSDAKIIKNLCDQYHRTFIENVLEKYHVEGIEKYYNLFNINNKTDDDKKEIKAIVKSMRDDMSCYFTAQPEFDSLFKKDIIEKKIVNIAKTDYEKECIGEFKKFTTYFIKYFDVRKNLYKSEGQHSEIAYRIFDENLPIYIMNCNIWQKIKNGNTNLSSDVKKEFLDKLSVDIDELLSLNNFDNVLTQKGIDNYNLVISGKVDENGKIKGINELINESNNINEVKYQQMKKLYKQVLFENDKQFDFSRAINSDEELTEMISSLFDRNNSDDDNLILSLNNITKTIEKIDSIDGKSIRIKSKNINLFSNKIFNEWNKIRDDYYLFYDNQYNAKLTNAYIEKRKKWFDEFESFSVYDISEKNSQENDLVIKNSIKTEYQSLINHFIKCLHLYDNYFNSTKQNSKIKNNKDVTKLIKDLLDSIKELESFISIFDENVLDIEDQTFATAISNFTRFYSNIDNTYNSVRNYITSKPYRLDKYKLNFENPQLLGGWDLNKENDYKSIILIKDGVYYLGIYNPLVKTRKLKLEDNNYNGSYYEKMEYKLLPSPNKMLPKVCFSKKGIAEFKPSTELMDKYDAGIHKKSSKDFSLEFCHQLIDYFKECISKYDSWKNFGFIFSDTNEYNDINEFYKEIESQGYNIRFSKISESEINEMIDNNEMYLFQLYSKDFSKYSTGKANLHTMYFKELFSDYNIINKIYKLNGNAEMFYRKKSLNLNETTVHKKGEPIENKNPYNKKEESIFEYDIIKDRRYTENQFFLHIPITMNYISKNQNRIGTTIREEIIKDNKLNIIGIDRGERNLLYVNVINEKGEILEQKSLNVISNKYKQEVYKTDYHHLLDVREVANQTNRKDWNTIEGIKDLKEGYISQAVHEICCLIQKYNAIVALEDLDATFKNNRKKVEKQVYQKFEKMLIDKLNYYVDKNKDKNDIGGLYHAYQLTDKFESFQKMGKQNGILFYVPSWLTSKIDPTTGFVNLIDTKYKSIEDSKNLIRSFDSIVYDKDNGYFVFSINYDKFQTKNTDFIKKWDVCSYGDRIRKINNPNTNVFDEENVNLTKELTDLFEKYNIDIYSKNLINEISNIESKEFYQNLLSLIALTLQMRNSSKSGEDYMISPIKNKNNEFFDSRKHDPSLPFDADSNGAYHIALKALILYKKLRVSENPAKENMCIKNADWLEFAQSRNL